MEHLAATTQVKLSGREVKKRTLEAVSSRRNDDILGSSFQEAITELGYLGLILIVFEGGLSTNVRALYSNLVLSLFVALTGITLPIGLSFLLVKMCGASFLQAFAAGCALSSTSLGTTFTILKSSGLGHSRLGVVLTSAAMLDDVVGLILVQVISNLGSSTGDFSAVTVVRPVFVSFGYAALVPVLLYLFRVLGPTVHMSSGVSSRVSKVLAPCQGKFIFYTALLIGAVASAAYAGTSVLFAAYLVGLLISSGEDYRRGWRRASKDLSPAIAQEERKEGEILPDISTPKDTNDSWDMVNTNRDFTEREGVMPNLLLQRSFQAKIRQRKILPAAQICLLGMPQPRLSQTTQKQKSGCMTDTMVA